jgi:hypothetical protein
LYNKQLSIAIGEKMEILRNSFLLRIRKMVLLFGHAFMAFPQLFLCANSHRPFNCVRHLGICENGKWKHFSMKSSLEEFTYSEIKHFYGTS